MTETNKAAAVTAEQIEETAAETIVPVQQTPPQAFNENLNPATPSWFTQSYNRRNTEDLMQEYRDKREHVLEQHRMTAERLQHYRDQLDQRLNTIKSSQQVPDDYSQVFVEQPHRHRQSARRNAQTLHVEQSNQPRRSTNAILVTTGLVSALLLGGGGIGLLMNQENFSLPGFVMTETAVIPEGKAARVVADKTVVTASLDVKDIKGTVGDNIPLAIRPIGSPPNASIIYKISGVPPEAYITKGKQTPEGDWMLKETELQNAGIVVSANAPPVIGLEVAPLIESSGEIVAPSKPMQVAVAPPPELEAPATQGLDVTVEPAAAPPQTNIVSAGKTDYQEATAKGDGPAENSLAASGQSLLDQGDITQARTFFEQAFKQGDPAGAFGLAQSYDPNVFENLQVRGVKPDKEKAISWYKKAVKGGVEAAQPALEMLQN